MDLTNVSIVNTGIILDFAHGRENITENIYDYISFSSLDTLFSTTVCCGISLSNYSYIGENRSAFYLNGKKIYSRENETKAYIHYKDTIYKNHIDNIIKNLKRVVIESATLSTYGYATRVHYISLNNDIFTAEFEFKRFNSNHNKKINNFSLSIYKTIPLDDVDFKVRVQVVTNVKQFEITNYVPDITKIDVQPLDLSKFKVNTNDETKHKIIPPGIIPLELPDGTPVKVREDGTFVDPDGNPIPDEDSIIVKDPIRTPEDDGFVDPDGNKLPDPTPPQTPTPSPDDTDLKSNLPWEIIIALLDMLRSILSFMARLFAFILTLPLIDAKPINNTTFVWFRDAEFFGIKIYNVVSSIAMLSLSLLIYKIVRRVF